MSHFQPHTSTDCDWPGAHGKGNKVCATAASLVLSRLIYAAKADDTEAISYSP